MAFNKNNKYVQVSQVCPSTASEDFLEGSHFPKAVKGQEAFSAAKPSASLSTRILLRICASLICSGKGSWTRMPCTCILHILPHGFHVPKVGKFPHSLAFIKMWCTKSSPVDLRSASWLLPELPRIPQHTHSFWNDFLGLFIIVLQLFQHLSDPTSNEQSLELLCRNCLREVDINNMKTDLSASHQRHILSWRHVKQKGMWPPPLSQPSFCSWPFFQFPTESLNDQLGQEDFRTAANYHSETPHIGLWIRSFTHQQHGKSRCDAALGFEFLLRKSREKKN